MLLFVSQGRLDDSIREFNARDCNAAIASADSSTSALGSRAEPYEVLAYCEFRNGSVRAALADIQRAVDRDPDNWDYHLDLALFRAAAGLDPLPAARTALSLNPLEPATGDAVRRFRRTDDPRVWKRQARVLLRPAFE
jgi:Flp pilus assembly protein TadD